MSPRKLTEDDKQEILQLYRNSEATTSTLANRYEVSSSTISRFLKNKLSSTEYEDLIQQKRLARTPRGETTAKAEKEPKQKKKTTVKAKKEPKQKEETPVEAKKTRKKSSPKSELNSTETIETEATLPDIEPAEVIEPAIAQAEPKSPPKRRRRRRSSASDELELSDTTAEVENVEELSAEVEELEELSAEVEEKPVKVIINKKVTETSGDNEEADKPSKSSNLVLRGDKPTNFDSSGSEDDEHDEEENEVDLITLKEMLGEDLEDINDEEDDEEDDDWEEENEANITYSQRDSSFSDLEILPLSQANFSGTCYLVIDRSAELIVKPLAEFGDLGEIPEDEVRQRTLPVFDNHRIAKRFSHRRERVIKVPDGRMLQKTSRHLQEKGITRLLMDGQIYSLLN